MSLSQKLMDIAEQIEIRFQGIDGEDDFHYFVDHENIYMRHFEHSEVQSYPAICISSLGTTSSAMTDQETFEVPIEFEIFGYINEESKTDILFSTLKLAQDMEKTIYRDETLNNNVWLLSLDFEVATLDSYGLIRMTLRAMTDYIKE